MKRLASWLSANASSENYLFATNDLRAVVSGISDHSYRALLSRAVSSGLLEHICRGIYLYSKCNPNDGLILYHIANLRRADNFNYISLESALSDAGVISQLPMNYLSLISSGRSNTIKCSGYGTIEYVHSTQKPSDIREQLAYDQPCKLWRANVQLAIRDMKATHRNCDLINWDIANEFI
jgi:predicted transcriptional regulator of viral defense system